MSVSKAHTRASKKYNAKTYKTFTVNAKIAEYEKITEYCHRKMYRLENFNKENI